MPMKEAVELIVRHLVHEAEAVDVRAVERDRATTVIEVRVAQPDVGKIIGRQGRTVKALRSLLHAAGQKHNRRYVLEIVE
ncbi:MAG: KH domain-containing protein [Acidobacteriota bacterium]|nr:KH domain-containing protein [Acidobacteriota bacterium]